MEASDDGWEFTDGLCKFFVQESLFSLSGIDVYIFKSLSLIIIA